MTMQPCGVAGLMSAIFKIPLEEAFAATYLELCPYRKLGGEICNTASKHLEYYPYCVKHKKGPNKQTQAIVPLICDECGILFDRPQREVIGSAKRGQQNIFCGYICSGKYAGKTFGWAVHEKGAKVNRAKTHCPQGHAYTEDNTYWVGKKKTGRICRTCTKQRSRAKREATRTEP